MANKERGEVALKVGNRTFVLCLTLGALAKIETQFGIESLADLGTALEKPSASKLLGLIHALILGGAEADDADPAQKGLTLEALEGMQLNLKDAMKAIKETMALVNTNDEDDAPAGEGKPGEDAAPTP